MDAPMVHKMETLRRLVVIALIVAAAAVAPVLPADAVSTKVVPAPTTTRLFPAQGPLDAGTRVTVKGTNFTRVTKVWFGSKAGTAIVVDSKSQLKVTAPAGVAGAVPVRVTAAGGTTHSAPAARYTYLVRPNVFLSVNHGPASGGTTIRVTGPGMVNPVVTMGGQPVGPLSFDVGSPGRPSFTFTTAPHAEGEVWVVVTTPGGMDVAHFSYADPPNMTLSASSGPASGGGNLELLNHCTAGPNRVKFDNTLARHWYTFDTPPRVYVQIPPHAPGTVDVELVCIGGIQLLPYTYTP